MFRLLKKIINENSLTLAVIYTLGHVIIAMNVVYWLTGSTIWEAGVVALVEPCINGVWFYVLHKTWVKLTNGN
ncbi:MAG: hypothetical protein CMK23_08745 [Porticoccaceae bacterium]|nr:hypothetical protein [Porticoccaceae bacterium]